MWRSSNVPTKHTRWKDIKWLRIGQAKNKSHFIHLKAHNFPWLYAIFTMLTFGTGLSHASHEFLLTLFLFGDGDEKLVLLLFRCVCAFSRFFFVGRSLPGIRSECRIYRLFMAKIRNVRQCHHVCILTAGSFFSIVAIEIFFCIDTDKWSGNGEKRRVFNV